MALKQALFLAKPPTVIYKDLHYFSYSAFILWELYQTSVMSYGNRGGSYGGGYNRYGGERRGSDGPKPVEVGKVYDVEVTETSRQGDGIARVQGFVIFVKGSKPGQKVKVKIASVGPRFATGQVATESSSAEQPKTEEVPQVTEKEKPELQDYKSTEESKPTE